MNRRFYIVTRDLHLYLGLFLSPFVLIFALSVLYLVHPERTPRQPASPNRTVSDVPVSMDIENLSGREQVAALRPVLKRIGVEGEIDFIRRIPKEHRLVFPVLLPGHEVMLDINLEQRTAAVTERKLGVSDAVVHLHKMPGPHNASVRGNSTYIRSWRILADLTTYGILFLTLSGVYLWAVLTAERRIGMALLFAGGLSFFGIIYALAR